MEMNNYQEMAIRTAIYNKKYSCLYPALGLAGEAGETCEKVKKLIRDSEFEPEIFCSGTIDEDIPQAWFEKREEIKKEIGDVIWYCAALARDFGLKLGDIAELNIEKLRSRAERNAIKGSGDNR
jgi:NTP pyrophosphatase (non-canonical NTP hydrolase)